MSEPKSPLASAREMRDRAYDNRDARAGKYWDEQVVKLTAEATYPAMNIEDIDADTTHAIIRAQQGLPK